MLFKVSIGAGLDNLKKVIEDEVGKAEDKVKNTLVEILFNTIAVDNLELKTLVWINSVYIENSFKKNLQTIIYTF